MKNIKAKIYPLFSNEVNTILSKVVLEKLVYCIN